MNSFDELQFAMHFNKDSLHGRLIFTSNSSCKETFDFGSEPKRDPGGVIVTLLSPN